MKLGKIKTLIGLPGPWVKTFLQLLHTRRWQWQRDRCCSLVDPSRSERLAMFSSRFEFLEHRANGNRRSLMVQRNCSNKRLPNWLPGRSEWLRTTDNGKWQWNECNNWSCMLATIKYVFEKMFSTRFVTNDSKNVLRRWLLVELVICLVWPGIDWQFYWP